MSLLLPDHFVPHDPSPGGPFDRDFFAAHFRAGVAPSCDLFSEGEVPVVELELINGETCDVYAFEAFKRDTLYYVRAIEEPSPTQNADSVGCLDVPIGEDCLSDSEHRAWSSPIFVDYR